MPSFPTRAAVQRHWNKTQTHSSVKRNAQEGQGEGEGGGMGSGNVIKPAGRVSCLEDLHFRKGGLKNDLFITRGIEKHSYNGEYESPPSCSGNQVT